MPEFSSALLFWCSLELGRTYGFQFLNKGKIPKNFCFNVCFLDTVTNTQYTKKLVYLGERTKSMFLFFSFQSYF